MTSLQKHFENRTYLNAITMESTSNVRLISELIASEHVEKTLQGKKIVSSSSISSLSAQVITFTALNDAPAPFLARNSWKTVAVIASVTMGKIIKSSLQYNEQNIVNLRSLVFIHNNIIWERVKSYKSNSKNTNWTIDWFRVCCTKSWNMTSQPFRQYKPSLQTP